MADIDLPPGFRFHPTDEEIITHYLTPKATNPSFTASPVMRDIDLNKCEPWDLPGKATMGEKEWYFYYHKDRKYPTGTRTNRATEAGYWKATGKDKEIFMGRGVLVGMKKTLVFYKGRAPRGEKTNWVMHEFRLEGRLPLNQLSRNGKDEWVVCRVFNKGMGAKKSPMEGVASMNSFCEDVVGCPTLPPLMDHSSCFDSSSFADAMLPPYMMGMEDFNPNSSNINQYCNNPTSSALYLPQPPYFHDHLIDASAAIRRHCKVEQYSGQSMLSASQDTGLSMEKNMEMSISSKNIGGGDDLDDPNSVGQVLDLDNMWKY